MDTLNGTETRKKILIVDDDKAVRNSIASLIRLIGITDESLSGALARTEILSAKDGSEALKLLQGLERERIVGY